MAERGINIEDIEQRVVRGFFVMDMLVDLKDLTIDLSELITGLLTLGKKIDIHPSLLPYFPGPAPYKQAYESGVRVHGCTAHFVTEQLDEGPVIMQDVFHINVGVDSLDDVKRKGLELEANVLSKAVQLFLDEELVVVEGKVIFKPGLSRFLKTART